MARRPQCALKQVLGAFALSSGNEAVGFLHCEAKLNEPITSDSAWIIATRDSYLAFLSAEANNLLSQLDEDPLRRPLADSRHRL